MFWIIPNGGFAEKMKKVNAGPILARFVEEIQNIGG
jgi:hypothetical protein